MIDELPKGATAYSFQIDPESDITYADLSFKSFKVREVYIGGKQRGEYHIQPSDGKNYTKALMYLRPHFPDCSIGLADPSGLLNLEYPIYLVCKNNPMVMDMIPQIFEKIDEEIGEKTLS